MPATSFAKTPQAVDDNLSLLEDLVSGGATTVLLNVLANDLGGNAKALYSIDDGFGGTLPAQDLLAADSLVGGVSAWETTASGNLARINNGKIEVDLANTFAALGISGIDGLTAADTINDTLVYAIRLGSGALSWARVNFSIQGQNDAATISGVAAAGADEDSAIPLSGNLIVRDPDRGESAAQIATGNTAHGDFAIAADGTWTFVVDNASVQALDTGQSVVDSFVFESLDGSAATTINITINGANESPTDTSIPVPNGPYGIVASDLNSDGVADLVFTEQYADVVAVMLGIGDGSFGAVQTYATPGTPSGVAIADYNGDGRQDIAVSSYLPGGPVQMYFGNGDGTFGGGFAFDSGADYAPRLAEGDFNEDHVADLVVANNLSSGVVVLLGNGDGTFQSSGTYSTGTSATDISVSDFDNDGTLDIAASASFGNSVTILIGNGDGTFGVSAVLAGGGTHGNQIADLNGDGLADLLAVHGGTNLLNVFIGKGDGSFQALNGFAVGTSPYWLQLGDMNGDGDIDAVTGNLASRDVSILFGNGEGSFGAEIRVAPGDFASGVTIADLNGDGRLDLAVSDNIANTVTPILNDWYV